MAVSRPGTIRRAGGRAVVCRLDGETAYRVDPVVPSSLGLVSSISDDDRWRVAADWFHRYRLTACPSPTDPSVAVAARDERYVSSLTNIQ